MNPLLCLGLWMLFSIGLVSGIQCGDCVLHPAGGICRFQKWPCTLYPGMSCYKKEVFYGQTLLYTKKGCMSNCKNIKATKEKYIINEEIMCCSHRDFCNR